MHVEEPEPQQQQQQDDPVHLATQHPSTVKLASPIDVHLVAGKTLVWDPEGANVLRTQCRLVGDGVGSLPAAIKQNRFLGLPILLLPEQITFALKYKWIRLVESKELIAPIPEELAKFDEARKRDREEQQKKYFIEKKRKEEQFRQKAQSEEIRKKLKSIENLAKEKSQHQPAPAPPASSSTTSLAPAPQAPLPLPATATSAVATETPTSPTKPIIEPISSEAAATAATAAEALREKRELEAFGHLTIFTQNVFESVAKARKDISAEWKFPTTPKDSVKCRIFEDLWSRGYFITPASRFGGDYLCYPSDPLRWHAHFVVIILEWDKPFHALDFVSVGRLGNTVKKSPLLAAVSPSGEPVYYTIDWQGVT